MPGRVNFKCIEVEQPIGVFYIGAINCKDLYDIAYADVRRIECENREVEKYLGIQRPLSAGRIAELKQYVENIDATFPTSIILAVNDDDASFDNEKMIMSIKRGKDVAKIIDGQHRIAGLENYMKSNFQLNVTIFIDMDIEDQAMVFATINLKQTKVNKSLATDLYEFTKSRSPQKTCHNIAKLLNEKNGSPFQRKIKILGVATGEPQESLTQATFVDRLIKYISRNPMKDRDLIKRGKKLEKAQGNDERKLIFRNLFIDDEDAKIAKNIWNFFKAVENRWTSAWQNVERGYILNRTTGFGALMRFLNIVYNYYYNSNNKIISVEEYLSVLKNIKLNDVDFTSDNYKPGSSGEKGLLDDLMNQSKIG